MPVSKGNNPIQKDIKQQYHDLGFNIIALNENKVGIDVNGNNLTGPLLTEHQSSIPDHVLKSQNWGIRHSTSKDCENILFLDWDKGQIPEDLQKLMLTVRRNNEQMSYHGIIRIIDGDANKCKEIVKNYKVDGLEIFHTKRNFAMFGMYNIKDEFGGGESCWQFRNTMIEDKRILNIKLSVLQNQLNKHGKQKGIQTSLTRLNPQQQVPAGNGMRHTALIPEVISILKQQLKDKTNPDLFTFDNIIVWLKQSNKITQLDDYTNDESKKTELENIIKWCIDHIESDPKDMLVDLISRTQGLYFAHDLSDTSDEFNTYWWNKTKWSNDTQHMILDELSKYESNDIPVSEPVSRHIKNVLSTSKYSLQVDPTSTDYQKITRRYIVTEQGTTFDLHTGTLDDMDPTTMFFRKTHIKIPIHDGESKVFMEFLNDRMTPRDVEVTLDQMASVFLHNSVLGAKPKALTIQGKSGTWKSVIYEILHGILSINVISEQSMSGLNDNERWAKHLIGDCLANVQEEASPARIQHAKIIKEVITAMSGKAEVKGGGERYISGYPKWFILCNKIQPLPLDDDDESIFVRNQYVEFLDVTNTEKDWRTLLVNEEELSKIVRTLLNRAHIIYKTKKPNMQTIEETKQRYDDLVGGNINKFLEEQCETEGVPPTIGTSFMYLWNLWNKTQPNKTSRKVLAEMLESAGYEKKTRVRVFRGEYPYTFDEYYSRDVKETQSQQTIVMGIAPKQEPKMKGTLT